MKLRELVDRVVADGVITPEEHKEIVDLVCADPALSEEERGELGRLREMIDNGTVRFAGEPEADE
jgi:polyhydroxyalkanoate synthesis regulator phasin